MIPDKLREIAKLVHEEGTQVQESVSVRTLLSWFGAKRRRRVVDKIRHALDQLGLVTKPDFTNVYIDTEIFFASASESNEIESKATTEDSNTSATYMQNSTVDISTMEFVYGAIKDPTFRIGQLASANSTLISVKPDSELAEAITLMMIHDFSQLPVMQNERELKGVISWESIGRKNFLTGTCKNVRDCMEIRVPEAPPDSSLFNVIDTIIKHGYVFVRQHDRKISGIVTTSDLSLQFHQLAEPFLLVGEIENYVRYLIDGKFTNDQLNSVLDSENPRQIESLADLTFGEYLRLLEKPDYWDSLNISIDRNVFIKHLDIIRELRNDIMHFDPDPFDEEDIKQLRSFANFMRVLNPQKI